MGVALIALIVCVAILVGSVEWIALDVLGNSSKSGPDDLVDIWLLDGEAEVSQADKSTRNRMLNNNHAGLLNMNVK